MIFELMICGAIIGAGGLINYARDAEKWRKLASDATVLTPTIKPQLSDAGELIVELIRSDEGWMDIHPDSATSIRLRHDVTGTVVSNRLLSHGRMTNVYITSDSGSLEDVDITNEDGKAIYGELKAYKTRERDRKQRELKKSLAQRILAVERGEVRPVLGDHRVRPANKSNESIVAGSISMDKIRADTPGLLTYDSARQQIVTVGNGDKLQLSDYLRKRYDMLRVGCTDDLYKDYDYGKYL